MISGNSPIGSIYPALQVWIIKPIAVIIHAAVDVDFFARETIDIGAGEGAAGGNGVAERIVTVFGDHGLACLVGLLNLGSA